MYDILKSPILRASRPWGVYKQYSRAPRGRQLMGKLILWGRPPLPALDNRVVGAGPRCLPYSSTNKAWGNPARAGNGGLPPRSNFTAVNSRIASGGTFGRGPFHNL